MHWEKDWKRWTQTTYGVLQSVHLASQLDLGNFNELERVIEGARSWSTSSLGFTPAAPRRSAAANSRRLRPDQVPDVVALLKSATLDMLLIGTLSVVETLLAELLVASGVVKRPPAKLSGSLWKLRTELKARGLLGEYQWALTAIHELRLIRNIVVHTSGKWESISVKEATKYIRPAPRAGHRVIVGVDDLFAYRRAARTILNAAARLRLQYRASDSSRGTSSRARPRSSRNPHGSPLARRERESR